MEILVCILSVVIGVAAGAVAMYLFLSNKFKQDTTRTPSPGGR